MLVAAVKAVSTSPAVKTAPGVEATQSREWSSIDVEHFDLGAVGEAVVGDVELPALVRGVRAEPLVAGFRAFVRLRGDESAGGQDPPDRRDRRHRVGAVALFEVGGDGGRAGFVAVPVEVFAQRDDLVLDRLGGAARARVRPS